MSVVYPLVKTGARMALPIWATIRTEGIEHVPRSGPAIIFANHESVLDPFLIQTRLRRTVYSMTKSTQFASPVMRWLVPRLGGFPTRRYRVDPQAVRTALRILERGDLLGLYPEGERTWDGALQPLRRGAVNLALKAGVPVIPCGLSGAYGVWARWAKGPTRGKITIRFGEPLSFGAHDGRAARRKAFPEAAAALEGALRALRTPTEDGRGEEGAPPSAETEDVGWRSVDLPAAEGSEGAPARSPTPPQGHGGELAGRPEGPPGSGTGRGPSARTG